MKVAILTSPTQWFESFAEELAKKLGGVEVFRFHEHVTENYDVLFILSYHRIVDNDVLKRNKHNLVVHESALPEGKGWAPLFWQVLGGDSEITFTLFEAAERLDDGPIYMQKSLMLEGIELNKELRAKQAELTICMCTEFIDNYDQYFSPRDQVGESTYFPRRTEEDSQLDIKKTIEEQFNLLRIVDNDEYPAFFIIDGVKYYLKIYNDEGSGY